MEYSFLPASSFKWAAASSTPPVACKVTFKAALPYVRRREYAILARRHSELIDELGWRALPASQARLTQLKAADLLENFLGIAVHKKN